MKRVATEQPHLEQWRLLLRFAYEANVSRHFVERGITATSSIVETVNGSILQAHAYYESAAIAPIHISPLLLYYGTINLLHACTLLKTGVDPNIQNHGMQLEPQTTSRLADATIRIVNQNTGALTKHAIALGATSSTLPPPGTTWQLSELFGSIPDLFHDFVRCYGGTEPCVLPVEVVTSRSGVLERIEAANLTAFASTAAAFGAIADFQKHYLPAQGGRDAKYVVLRRRLGAAEIGIYSITGRKHLPLAHRKGAHLVTLQPLINLLMTLFALGTISRYRPAFWTPFVRSDTTGERLLVDKLLDVARRQVPNLVLDHITGEVHRFVYETDGYVDLTATIDEAELRMIVEEKVRERLDE